MEMQKRIIQNKRGRGESAALGHFSIFIFFGQVENKESKNEYSSMIVV